MTVEDIIREVKSNPLCKGITFSGGCPMCNAYELITLAKKLKQMNYNIWMYCGERLGDLNGKQLELLQYADVLVDGKYIEEEKDLNLKFRTSKNQRILRNGIDFFVRTI